MFPILKRNRYFTGRILTGADFELEQQYFINRMKLHNRYLHGYGVVSGLQVKLSNAVPPEVIVSPGYAIDAEGNDVLVSIPQRVPLPAAGRAVTLCIRWAQRETGRIPVPGAPAGDLDLVEASLVEEYAILAYERELPSVRPMDSPEEGSGVGNGPGIALARLVRQGGVWKIDPGFQIRQLSL
jgi:hypothetical protein